MFELGRDPAWETPGWMCAGEGGGVVGGNSAKHWLHTATHASSRPTNSTLPPLASSLRARGASLRLVLLHGRFVVLLPDQRIAPHSLQNLRTSETEGKRERRERERRERESACRVDVIVGISPLAAPPCAPTMTASASIPSQTSHLVGELGRGPRGVVRSPRVRSRGIARRLRTLARLLARLVVVAPESLGPVDNVLLLRIERARRPGPTPNAVSARARRPGRVTRRSDSPRSRAPQRRGSLARRGAASGRTFVMTLL